MKTIQKYLLTVLVLGATVGCKERMIELNTNPETVSSVNLQYLFTGATNGFDGYGDRDPLTQKVASTMQTMQYVSKYGGGDPYLDPITPGKKQVESYIKNYDQYYNQGNQLYTILREIEKKDPVIKPGYNDLKAMTQTILAFQQWRVLQQFGAMVYKEAFKAQTEGIGKPKYDLGQDIYKDIDALFKEAIEILSQPKAEGTIEVGANDFFNGYTSTVLATGGSVVSKLGQYNTQRAKWLKFANMARLEMAWKLKATDNAFYEMVKSETLAVPNGIMTSDAEGTYYHYQADAGNNPDDVDVISQQYGISAPFCNTLIKLNDPRLQYVARPTGLSPVNSRNFRIMQTYYPDTLAAYGDIFNGKQVFVGHTTNPKFKDDALLPLSRVSAARPNFPAKLTQSFTLINPNYPDSLGILNPETGKVELVTKLDKFALELQIVSPIQTRYFVKCGGKNDKNGSLVINTDVNSLRWDGKGGVWDDLFLRCPVFTYAQQCFMFAYLEITTGGKSPAEWYAEGVRSAMKELRSDALRFKIQVAVNTEYPKFPDYNPAGTYSYTDSQIDAYVAANPYSLENTACQAWIYFFQAPEKAYEWWKLTGFPKIVDIPTLAQAAAQPNAYMEKPYKKTSDVVELLFPRRGALPDRQTVNEINFMDVKAMLESQPGFMEWNATQGRIWWDKQ